MPDSFVFLPKSRRRRQHTKDGIPVLKEDGILIVRMGNWDGENFVQLHLAKSTYKISAMQRKFHKAPSLDEDLQASSNLWFLKERGICFLLIQRSNQNKILFPGVGVKSLMCSHMDSVWSPARMWKARCAGVPLTSQHWEDGDRRILWLPGQAAKLYWRAPGYHEILFKTMVTVSGRNM